MKYIVKITYSGTIEMETEAPNESAAEKAALDDIDTWSEELFYERLDLEIEDVEFEQV